MTHEEAIKILREVHDNALFSVRTALETLIPELAESEDERIRKSIIHILQVGGYMSPEEKDKAFAYLEKQKENVEKEYVFRPLAGTDITIAAEQAIRRANEGDRLVLAFNGAYIPVRKGCNASKIVDIYDAFIEKQKESLHIQETCKENTDSFTDEDEMIRKELLDFVRSFWADHKEKLPQVSRWVTYLEKQKEPGIKWLKSDNVKNPDKPYIDKAGMFYTTDGRMCYASEIEKQKEQKPSPKFNVGDKVKYRGDIYKITDVECDKETEIQKAFREGQNAGRQEVFDHPGTYGLENIDNVFGFKIGDKVRLIDGDGRPHIIKYFERIEGLHGPDFYRAVFEDNTASDHIIPGDEYPNGYFTCMEKIGGQKEQKPIKMEVYEAGKGTTICGQDYKCKKDYKEGNCRYIKDAIYHCSRDGYLNDQNGVGWSCTPEWLNEHIQSNTEWAEEEKTRFVSGQFLQCKLSFDEFKEGEHYWLEYVGDDMYVGRSDNILNQKFHITPRQLYTLFSQQLEEVQGPPQEEKQVSLNYEPPFNENPSDREIIEALIHHLNEQDGFLTAINCISTKAILSWLIKQKEQDKCPEYCVRSHCIGCSIYEKQKEQNKITIEQVYKEFITPEKLKDAKTNKYIKAQLLWELMHNGIITEVDYMYLTDDKRKPWTAEEYRIAYQKGFEMSEQLKQKEQKPVEPIEFSNEFENQVSHLLASVLNGEHEYNEGFVKYVAQSLLGYAKEEQKPSIFPPGLGEVRWNPISPSSIKQKPAEWGEEDETYLQDALWCIEKAEEVAKGENDMGICWCARRWLKFLPERFKFQPKPEWSEEDEQNYKVLRSIVHGTYVVETQETMDKLLDWLKSLRPSKDCLSCAQHLEGYISGRIDAENKLLEQFGAVVTPEDELHIKPRWKPSEEQIRALEKAIIRVHSEDEIPILTELRQQLKKLM